MSTLSQDKFVAVLLFFTKKIDDYLYILYYAIFQSSRREDSYHYDDVFCNATDFKGELSTERIWLNKIIFHCENCIVKALWLKVKKR